MAAYPRRDLPMTSPTLSQMGQPTRPRCRLTCTSPTLRSVDLPVPSRRTMRPSLGWPTTPGELRYEAGYVGLLSWIFSYPRFPMFDRFSLHYPPIPMEIKLFPSFFQLPHVSLFLLSFFHYFAFPFFCIYTGGKHTTESGLSALQAGLFLSCF